MFFSAFFTQDSLKWIVPEQVLSQCRKWLCGRRSHHFASSEAHSVLKKDDMIGSERYYNATGKVRRMAKNIGFRMELLGTPKVRLGVPA